MAVLFLGGQVQSGEPYMLPYKETMIIMTHGINSDRYTWVEKDTEGNINKNSNNIDLWWHYLNKELKVSDLYLQAYSFSSRSGRHEEGMMEMGYGGYENPAGGEVETNGIVKQAFKAGIKFGEIMGLEIGAKGAWDVKETQVKSGMWW